MLVVIALLRGITPSGKECKEDEPEPAQLHADEIRDEDDHAGAKNVLHLNLRKARTMRTFRRRERPGKGYGQGQDEESELRPPAAGEKSQERDHEAGEPERCHAASHLTGIVAVG